MRAAAILHQRCPKCLKGDVFKGKLTMHDSCPECGTRFVREAGYFLGAWYINYALQLVVVVPVIAVFYVVQAPISWYVVLGIVAPLLCTVLIYRYARVLWLHLDQRINPRD